MRRAAWLCASLLSFTALKPLAAQSSHLSDLERAAPATTADPVATGAAGAWRATWTVPAAAPSLRGVLIGLEQNEFGGVMTVLASARVHLGLLWQLNFAETHVSDVVDQELLSQFPELGELRVMARIVGLDGVHTVGRTTLSLGVRQEWDDLLGVEASGPTSRGALFFRLGHRTAVAGVVDRAWASSLGTPAGVRAQFGVTHSAVTKMGSLQLNLGTRLGRLREAEFSETAVALQATLSVRDIVLINASAGSEKFSEGSWLWHGAAGVGIELASLGAHFRYIFKPEGRGASRAVAFAYTRHDGDRPGSQPRH